MKKTLGIIVLLFGLVSLVGIGTDTDRVDAFHTIGNFSQVPLANLGWAPGFEGGSGKIHYLPLNQTFIAEITVDGLKPNHEYTIQSMGADVGGKITGGSSSLMTDGDGSGVAIVALDLPDDAKPLPAYQVHVLVVDPSESLEGANPMGINNPIPLVCLYPLGFRVGNQ